MRKTAFILISFSALLAIGAAALQGETDTDRLVKLKTIRYNLDVRIDYEKEKINGECRLTIHNTGPETFHSVPLLLYRLLKVTSIKDGRGNELPFTQEVLGFEDWEKLQANCIQADIKTPLRRGEKETLAVEYSGYLLGYAETGMSYVKDSVNKDFTILRPDCWAYPVIGLPSWRAYRRMGMQSYDYTLNVTVPENLTGANGGRLVRISPANGWVTYTYENIKPAWRMDTAVADYALLQESQGRLRVFHFKDDAVGAQKVLVTLKSTIDLYSQWFGPLEALDGFTVIEIPDGFGSQADVTSILQTRAAFQKQDQMYQFYHEISHLFEVRLTDPFPSRFESEGMATFLQYLVQEKMEHREGSVKKGLDWAFHRLQKEFADDPKKKLIPMADYGKEDLTDLSYSKGMIFFAILHELMGEEKFLESIGSFYRKFRKTGATTADFVKHLESESPLDLRQFIKDWVYGTRSNQDIVESIAVESIVKKYKVLN